MLDSETYPWICLDAVGINRTTGRALEFTDVWTGENVGTFDQTFRPSAIPAHGCRLYRCKVVNAK